MVEFKELTERINKLKEFTKTIKFEALEEPLITLMKDQLHYMEGYQKCLYDRINLIITLKEMEEFDREEGI